MLVLVLQILQSCKKSKNDEPDMVDPVTADEPLPYEYTHWMANIDDCKSIREISIPGTHDSGADLHTSQQGTLYYAVIAQDYRLSNQLKLGVRWFDVRLRLHDGALTVHHGPYYLHKNFDDLLKPALNFLEEHPTEGVIFMIKQEHSSESDHDFAKAVYDRLKAHSSDLSKFCLWDGFPEMGNIRGKIYIVRRFHNDLGHSLGTYMQWDDNTKGEYINDGNSYYVQDHYKMLTVSYDTKNGEIKDCIKKAHEHSDEGILFLNFTSGERDLERLDYIANAINPVIESYLKSHSSWHNCGVIMVNFAGGADHYDSKSTGDINRYVAPNFVKQIVEQNDFSHEEVTIGDQVWMKKNLNVSFYRNGDKIPHVTNPQEWVDATYGAWCNYNNGGCFRIHGKFYNWHAVNDSRGLCPEGYHVPTDEEWTTLENYLGGRDVAGGKLKGTGDIAGWCDPNNGATNESGFTAPANGYRYGDYNPFNGRCYNCNYWTATGIGADSAYCRMMTTDHARVLRFGDNWSYYGYSVRCVKD